MRKNQISIKIQRFGDEVPRNFEVPENSVSKDLYAQYQKDDNRTHIISVYADANNLYEALV